MKIAVVAGIALGAFLSAVAFSAMVVGFYVSMSRIAHAEEGIASIYWQGTHLATGARFNPNEVLCAHKKLPFHTVVRVTDLDTGRSIDCPIKDRGPFIAGRIIDLSLGAANALGLSVAKGLTRVRVELLGK